MSTLPFVLIGFAALGECGGASAVRVHQERPASQLLWSGDVEQSKHRAAAEGKHVLVAFTGSEWCGHCQRLEAEVLGRPEFGRGVSEGLVLARVDFDPSLRARKDLPHPARADALREGLGVEAFPTLVLMTADGRPYQSFERPAGGAGVLADQIRQAQERAAFLEREVPRASSAVVRARDIQELGERTDAALQLLRDAGEHPLARPLIPLAKTALDVRDLPVTREKLAVAALAAAAEVDDSLVDRAFRLDPANVEGLPEAALAGAFRALEDPERVPGLVVRVEALLATGRFVDPVRTARLLGDAAFLTKGWMKDGRRAAALARAALELDPRDRELRTMLESLSGG